MGSPILGAAQPRAPREGQASPTRERLRDLVTEILDEKQIVRPFADDETLAEIGIASIDMVTLLLAVENAFDLEVPQEEITTDMFRSVATIDSLVQRLRPGTVPA